MSSKPAQCENKHLPYPAASNTHKKTLLSALITRKQIVFQEEGISHFLRVRVCVYVGVDVCVCVCVYK